jgi:hypothetical protein
VSLRQPAFIEQGRRVAVMKGDTVPKGLTIVSDALDPPRLPIWVVRP